MRPLYREITDDLGADDPEPPDIKMCEMRNHLRVAFESDPSPVNHLALEAMEDEIRKHDRLRFSHRHAA